MVFLHCYSSILPTQHGGWLPNPGPSSKAAELALGIVSEALPSVTRGTLSCPRR